MNHSPSQLRLACSRCHVVASRRGRGADVIATSVIFVAPIGRAADSTSLQAGRWSKRHEQHVARYALTSSIKPRRLPLGDLDRTLDVLAARVGIGERVGVDETGGR